MKESYPKSNAWPHFFTVMLLLAFLLAPPTKWHGTLLRLSQQLADWGNPREQQTEQPAVDEEKVIVAFDPQTDVTVNAQERSRTELSEDRETRKLPTVGPPSPTNSLVASVVELSDRLPVIDIHVVRQTKPSVSSHVWQPPPDWEPSVIQPLAGAPSNPTRPKLPQLGHNYEKLPQTPEPNLKSPIAPPVANRVARVPRVDRSLTPRLPRVRTDVMPIEAGSLSAVPDLHLEQPKQEQARQEQAEPKKLDPSAPESSDVLEGDRTESPAAAVADKASQKYGSETADPWPRSLVLDQLLQEADTDVVLSNWACAIRSELSKVEGRRVSGVHQQVMAVGKLRELCMLKGNSDAWPHVHRVLYHRLRFALLRRVDVWEPLLNVANVEPSAFATYRAQKALQDEIRRLRDNQKK